MGLNARKRKEQKLIEKYGSVPKSKLFPWSKVLMLIVGLAVIGIGGMYGYKQLNLKQKKTAASPSTTPESTANASENPTNTEEKTMSATIKTTLGDIEVELFKNDAPKTVENFQKLADKKYYDGIIFHRVIKDFMIQTGDPTGTGTGGESAFGKDFEDEKNGYKMEPGTLAMANRGPGTNGSQFFIVTESRQAHLEGKHTIFGKVTKGMDVVKNIAAVDVDGSDKPLKEVKMKKVIIKQK